MKNLRKRLLFITDTYYPDSSATTSITIRTAEALANLGYTVDVFPVEISGKSFSYSDKHNKVNIIKLNNYPRQNICFEKCRNVIYSIEKILGTTKYDYVFSVAEAFEVNLLTFQALKDRKCKWIPISYDPYAYNPHISLEQKKEFIKLEEQVFNRSNKIFLLKEFEEDYKNALYKEKIVYFHLPCIRQIKKTNDKCPINFDPKFINCVFLGDFYLGLENTDFIFRLFEKISLPVKLYTIGKLGDYENTINLWKEKLQDKYICHERISQNDAHNVMLNADVLISMGHDSTNMCPSKVIDFIASGKPILHIEKIKDCCGTKYLENYQNKICVYQNDELTDEKIQKIEKFMKESKSKERIPFDSILSQYSDFTMESLIKKIIKEIESK